MPRKHLDKNLYAYFHFYTYLYNLKDNNTHNHRICSLKDIILV